MILPIILLRPVTTRGTSATGFAFLKIERHRPITERHGVGHHLRLIRPMNSMAELTIPSPFRFIDMEIMQVPYAVTKAGRKGSVRKHKQLPLMAQETEIIFILAVVNKSLG